MMRTFHEGKATINVEADLALQLDQIEAYTKQAQPILGHLKITKAPDFVFAGDKINGFVILEMKDYWLDDRQFQTDLMDRFDEQILRKLNGAIFTLFIHGIGNNDQNNIFDVIANCKPSTIRYIYHIRLPITAEVKDGPPDEGAKNKYNMFLTKLSSLSLGVNRKLRSARQIKFEFVTYPNRIGGPVEIEY